MAAWFKFGRGVKSSPDGNNRSFKGDGSAYPVWNILGAGHPNTRQIHTVGALSVSEDLLQVQGYPDPSQAPVTYGAIQNPFVNLSAGLGSDAT